MGRAPSGEGYTGDTVWPQRVGGRVGGLGKGRPSIQRDNTEKCVPILVWQGDEMMIQTSYRLPRPAPCIDIYGARTQRRRAQRRYRTARRASRGPAQKRKYLSALQISAPNLLFFRRVGWKQGTSHGTGGTCPCRNRDRHPPPHPRPPRPATATGPSVGLPTRGGWHWVRYCPKLKLI